MDAGWLRDVLVGAPRYSADQPEEGAAFIFRGSPGGMLSPHTWQMEGNKNDTNFGFSVAAAGDVNDDEFSDVIAGAPLYKRDDKTIMGSCLSLPRPGRRRRAACLPDLFTHDLSHAMNPYQILGRTLMAHRKTQLP